MRALLIVTIILGLALHSGAQNGLRYRDLVFNKSTREKNLVYDSCAKNVKRHRLDIYAAAGDTVASRPVIILLHGGGFKFGSKNNSRMRIWGRRFARMGYVCIAMNYSLSRKKPLSRFADLKEACEVATGDVYNARQWLKQHHARLGIDTGRIILAGHSAGGMIALQTVYADGRQRKGVTGVVNFWGAIFDTTCLKAARVPIVSVHGGKDRIVPYYYSEAPVFGSGTIHRVADREGIVNALKTYPRLGHELQRHFNPLYAGPVARKRWREAAGFAADFLYVLLR
jgi:predicted esterase